MLAHYAAVLRQRDYRLLGLAAAGAWPVRRGLGRAIAVVQLGTAAAAGVLFLRPGLGGACVAIALVGAFSAPMTVCAQTLRMGLVPAGLRGHVFALLRTSMQAGAPVGGAAGGAALAGGVTVAAAFIASWIGIPGAVGLFAPSLSAGQAGQAAEPVMDSAT